MLDNAPPQTYPVTHRRSEYTLPTEARAIEVSFTADYMHIRLQDGRILAVPLAWLPSLAHAEPEALENYRIGWDGALIYWDPDDGPINENLLVGAYLRGGIDAPG